MRRSVPPAAACSRRRACSTASVPVPVGEDAAARPPAAAASSLRRAPSAARVSRPSRYGELAESASTAGSQVGRTRALEARATLVDRRRARAGRRRVGAWPPADSSSSASSAARGTISCSRASENGWLPAAAIASPLGRRPRAPPAEPAELGRASATARRAGVGLDEVAKSSGLSPRGPLAHARAPGRRRGLRRRGTSAPPRRRASVPPEATCL